MVTPPPAGWYADPAGSAAMRWWDGAAWTTTTSAWAPPAPGLTAVAGGLAPSDAGATVVVPASADVLAGRLATYQRVSGWLWLGIAVLQIVSVVAILAGLWNVFAAVTRIRSARAVEQRRADVPVVFRGIEGLVIIGLLNLVLGGVVGVVFVVLDVLIRDRVLKNAHIFDRPALTR